MPQPKVVGDVMVADAAGIWQSQAPATIIPANVPKTDVVNTFSRTQFVQNNAPGFGLAENDQPTDQKNWYCAVENQVLRLTANDDGWANALAMPLAVARSGDVSVGRDLYEKQRAVPMGHWVDVPFNVSNFTSDAPMTWDATGGVVTNRYTLIGKTLIWTVTIGPSTLSGSPSSLLHIVIPGGFVPAVQVQVMGQVWVSGAWEPALIISPAGQTSLNIYRISTSPYIIGGCYMAFQVVIPI